MKNSTINIGIIKKIARALGELNNQVAYVGGATVGLYINDPAADDVRPTKDIDLCLSLATISQLEHLRESLNKKGFIQTANDDVICRFRYEDVIVDVMNTKAIGWAPANPWFASGFAMKETLKIEDVTIQLLPLPYFLATKFAAYNSRGRDEPRTSHDFEDIVYVIDNRMDIVEQLQRTPKDVRPFLKSEMKSILTDKIKQEAISGNLFFETRDVRFNMIIEKITAIVQGFRSG